MNQTFNFFSKLFSASDWPARWHCGTWSSFHGWLYIISDLLIGASYFAIPVVIIKYISSKQGLRFVRVYYLFAASILACGATHFLDAVAFWYPAYRFNALLLFITAVISCTTVFYLLKYLPSAFALRSRDELRSLFFNEVETMFTIYDKNFNFVEVNDAVLKNLHLEREDIIGKNLTAISPDAEEKKRLSKYEEVIRTGNSILIDQLNVHPRLGDLHVRIKAFKMGEGIGMTITDTTDLNKTILKLEHTLREISAYKYALDESSIIAITDQKGIIRHVNENFCTISKYSEQELIGQDHRIINSGYHPKEFIKNLWRTIAKGEIWKGELKNKAKDGSYYWVDTTIVPFLDEERKPYQYLAIRADITERKRLEEEQQLFASIVNSSDDAIISKTLDGIITSWNKGAERIFGYEHNEIIGSHISVLIPEYLQNEEGNIANKIRNGEFIKNYETQRIKKNREIIYVSLTISPVKDLTGNIIGASKILRDITERKLSEEKHGRLFKELSDYKYALDEAAIVSIADVNTSIKYVNDKFCKTLQYSKAELIGKSLRSISLELHTEAYIDNLVQTISNGNVWKGEIQNKAKDGTPFWFQATIIPFINTDKKPYQYLTIRTDITERKLAEERVTALYQELVTSEKRFRALIEHSKDVFIISDELGVTFVSPSVEPVLGFTEDEYKAKKTVEIIHPDDHPLRWNELSEPGNIIHLEFRTLHKDGGWRWMEGTGMNLSDVEGIRGHVFTVRDITERKEWEQRLLESEKIYKTIVSSIPGSFINIFDRDYQYLLLDGDLVKQIGYDKKDLIGKRLSDVVHSKDYEDILPDLRKVFEGETSEKEIRRGALDMVYKFVPFKVEGNMVEEAMIVGIDVTELKHTQRELAELNQKLEEKVKDRTNELEVSNKELEAFSYSVSHDLRAPLRAVSGYSKIIEEDYFSAFDDDGKRLLSNIQRNATQMGILIDDLLSFSRLGKKEVHKSFVNMNELVNDVIDEVNTNTSYKASIHMEDLSSGYADSSLIKQVWVNYISNAFKYSSKKENPEIKIFSYHQDGYFVYAIQDNGSGFDMRYQNKLFAIFERLHTNQEFDGTGVGLAIVKRIVEKHKGKVWANSELEKGATFYFSLPDDVV